MKTHAQLAYEAYLGSEVDWALLTPATRDMWLKVAAAVLNACAQEAGLHDEGRARAQRFTEPSRVLSIRVPASMHQYYKELIENALISGKMAVQPKQQSCGTGTPVAGRTTVRHVAHQQNTTSVSNIAGAADEAESV